MDRLMRKRRLRRVESELNSSSVRKVHDPNPNSLLEGNWRKDGVIHAVYEILWSTPTRNSLGADRSVLKDHVWLPDTVIMTYGTIRDYYYTDPSGYLEKKEKRELTADRVFRSLTKKRTSSSGVVAVHIVTKNHKTLITYLDKAGLEELLYSSRRDSLHGLLQKFHDSRGAYHTTIQAAWSPTFCYIESTTNIHTMRNFRIPVADRMATFDGGIHNVRSEKVNSPVFVETIVVMMNRITKHIESALRTPRVHGIVCQCKVDKNNRVWLLWCSSLRTIGATSSNVSESTQPKAGATKASSRFRRPPPLNLNAPLTVDRGGSFRTASRKAAGISPTRSQGAKPVLLRSDSHPVDASIFKCAWCRKMLPVGDKVRTSFNTLMVSNNWKLELEGGESLSPSKTGTEGVADMKLSDAHSSTVKRENIVEMLGRDVDKSHIDLFLKEEREKIIEGLVKQINRNNQHVPLWFSRLFPKQTVKRFVRMSFNEGDCSRKLSLCFDCFVELTRDFRSESRTGNRSLKMPLTARKSSTWASRKETSVSKSGGEGPKEAPLTARGRLQRRRRVPEKAEVRPLDANEKAIQMSVGGSPGAKKGTSRSVLQREGSLIRSKPYDSGVIWDTNGRVHISPRTAKLREEHTKGEIKFKRSKYASLVL